MGHTLAVDHAYVVRTLTDLVRINSVNPSIAPDGAGEAEIAAYVASSLARAGLETAVHEPRPGRASAVARLAGSGGGRSLMLNAHADTVGIEGMPDPFLATRYHSLVIKRDTLPACLEVTAESDEGEIMGVRHKDLPIWGVQFHPESILTENGRQMMRNFLKLK